MEGGREGGCCCHTGEGWKGEGGEGGEDKLMSFVYRPKQLRTTQMELRDLRPDCALPLSVLAWSCSRTRSSSCSGTHSPWGVCRNCCSCVQGSIGHFASEGKKVEIRHSSLLGGRGFIHFFLRDSCGLQSMTFTGTLER